MATPASEVFVQNDKGTEYVGSVTCSSMSLPPKIVFDEYSRDPEVLAASRWKERLEWGGQSVALAPCEGKVPGFQAFLAGRKKAAIATCCDASGEPYAVLALLPAPPSSSGRARLRPPSGDPKHAAGRPPPAKPDGGAGRSASTA